MDLSQNPQVSSDINTKGFDLSAGKTWIYPENYPIRDYQFNIVQASLYKNTLVCLPTGLGKTFIAAVVMYNFWRWYPCGKVVFLAPSKPLVAQQIFACHNIMGIPSVETVELTGAVNKNIRVTAWSKKRVFFATPQIFHNDLESNIVPSDLVKCVVIDEAHKALGKHSYCECIRILSERNQAFRVLGLSATPGNKISNVHEVLQNLLIAHVELRDDKSLDILPYINQRKIDIILVPLDEELTKYKERYILIMDRHVKVLLQHDVLHSHAANISKGRIFHLLKEHQMKSNKHGNYGLIMKTLNILMTMYHAYEVMVRDGLRAFHKFYQNHSDKFWMNEEPQLWTLLEDVERYLGPFPDAKTLRVDAVDDIPENLVFGHTKFDKLKELLLRHFTNDQEKSSDTRAIVFVEYRDIVNEIYILLLQCRPLIRPQMFVGQAGLKQKEQVKALEDFRNNRVNVLISTSIGEEGLDVGEVDLIICFDVSQQSPTRLVQRMGRTGRKRDGHIIILVTDGREHETLRSTMARRDSLNTKVLNKSNIFSSLYQNNPRMIPDMFKPECIKMHISLQLKSPVTKGKKCKERPKKKQEKRQKDASATMRKEASKFTMMKYLKGDNQTEQCHNTFGASSTDVTQNSAICNTINASEVKILSCDNDAIDFLTKCAMRNSERDENKYKVEQSYVPEPAIVADFFNFSVPDISILDCLATLENVDSIVPENCDKKNTDNDDENDDRLNSFNISDCVFDDTMSKFDEKLVVGESRFEDLLDDSSASDKGDLSFKENAKMYEAESRNVHLNSLETGGFEDILNETSDEAEANAEPDVDFSQAQSRMNIRNDLYTEGRQHIAESKDQIKAESLFGGPIVEQESHSTPRCKRNDKSARGMIREEQNLPVATNESLFTLSQAIDEIERINSASSEAVAVQSDDDMFQDDSCFLQVNTQLYVCEERNPVNAVNDKDNVVERDGKSEELVELDGKSEEELVEQNVKSGEVADMDLKVDELDWDDDFEIPMDPLESFEKFVTPGKPGDKLQPLERNLDDHNSDSDEWFDVRKSSDKSKGSDTPSTSIAKKLGNIKRNWSLNNSLNDKTDARSSVRNTGKEKSFFFLDDTKSSSGSSRQGTAENRGKGNKQLRKSGRDRKSRRNRNVFIDDEARVSSDEDTSEGSSGTDGDLDGFVSYTQNTHDTSEMRAHYLQTIRSPMGRPGGFLFKQPRVPDREIEIYSQAVSDVDESYMNDSFCVPIDETGNQEDSQLLELSELEKAEQELERRKRNRKRKRNAAEDHGPDAKKPTRRNKRRNVVSYSSSSEDETERLREQIRNDSFRRPR